MRLIIGLVLGLFMLGNPVLAQIAELKVDNSTMPGGDIERAFINSSGGLEIQSIAGVEYEVRELGVCAPNEGSLISNLTLNGKTSLTLPLGESAEINWSAANADGCVASTATAGLLDDWNTDTAIGTEGPLSVTFQSTGNYILLLDCFTQDSSDTDVVTVTVEGASIIDFAVTPDTVAKGEQVTLTLAWESENTSSCSGSWTATPLAATDTQQISVVLNSTRDYTLTCNGSGVGNQDERTVEVLVPTVQDACNVTLQGSNLLWGDLFKTNWPGPYNEKLRVQIPERGYFSVEFNTGDVKDVGVLSNIESVATPGWRLGTISVCEGDFSAAAVCTYKWGDHGGIFWDTTGETDTGNCNLDPNQTYFWNMTFTDGVDPNTSRCAGSVCLTTLIPFNNDYVE